MTKIRRLTALTAVGAIALGAALAAPAFAQEEQHSPETDKKEVSNGDKKEVAKGDKKSGKDARAERRAYRVELRKTKRQARRALRHCKIAPEKLISVEDSKLLTKLKSRFDAKVDADDWTEQKAKKKLYRVQKRITVRAAMKTARWSPRLELFGAESRKDLGRMIRKADGVRSLMKAKGVTRADLQAAKLEGKLAQYKAVITLCASGEEPAEEKPAEEDPEKPAEEKAPATQSA